MKNRDNDGPAEHHWGRYGFLFADLFTALAILFLVANTVGHVTLPPPRPTPTLAVVVPTTSPTPTPTPLICGLDPQPATIPPLTVSDPAGLRAGSASAESAFADQVHSVMSAYSGKTAGLAEVSGGSFNGSQDVADGESLAMGAIGGLQVLAGQHIVFTTQRTIFQPFWDGYLASDQVKLLVFFYTVSSSSTCAA